MSRQNWDWPNFLRSFDNNHTASRVCIGVGLAVLLLTACTPLATPFPVPSATVPSATTATLAPDENATATLPPTLAPDLPLISSEIVLDPLLSLRLREDLADETNMSAADIRLIQIETDTWSTEDMGCSIMASEIVTTGTVVRLLAGQNIYTYHVSGTLMQRCGGSEIVHGELLTQIDPAALEMVLLAQQHVAQTLDLPTRRIRLVDVQGYTWPDTSLGCPLPEQTYTERPINGYRVTVAAGEETFAFHTDSERAVPCEAGREVLPA